MKKYKTNEEYVLDNLYQTQQELELANKRIKELEEQLAKPQNNEDYKSRIDKAIKYIERPDNIQSVAFCEEDGELMNLYKIDGVKSLELLDILKGSDK